MHTLCIAKLLNVLATVCIYLYLAMELLKTADIYKVYI